MLAFLIGANSLKMTTLPIPGQPEIVVRWGLGCLACAYSPVTELTFDLCKYQINIGIASEHKCYLIVYWGTSWRKKYVTWVQEIQIFFSLFFLLKRENGTSRQESPIKLILSLQNVKTVRKYNNIWTSATQNLQKQQTNGAAGDWHHPFCGDLGVFLWLHKWYKRKFWFALKPQCNSMFCSRWSSCSTARQMVCMCDVKPNILVQFAVYSVGLHNLHCSSTVL